MEDKMRKILLIIINVSVLVVASVASAQTPPIKVGNSAKGKVLTNEQGMTLYTFAKDSDGKSACNGTCVTNWPPLTAAADAKPANHYTVIVREDGSKQWAVRGKPLYTWKNDHKPGDITGDGFLNGAWHIAKP
jgi:predicted lipoprotein with Yx(FWY)xxD motif